MVPLKYWSEINNLPLKYWLLINNLSLKYWSLINNLPLKYWSLINSTSQTFVISRQENLRKWSITNKYLSQHAY